MIRRIARGLARRIIGSKPAPKASPQPHSPARRAATPEPEGFEVESDQLAKWLSERKEKLVFLDVREPHELLAGHAEGALLLPMNQVPQRIDEIPADKTLVVYCAAGARSFGVAGYLRDHGRRDAWSLVGGFGAYAAAGGPTARPPAGTKFRLASRVRTADGREGTVQAIRDTESGHRYTVRAADGATLAELDAESLKEA